MSVKVKIQDPVGTLLWEFIADDRKSLAQMAADNNIEIPVACCQGACYVCACKIKKWNEFVQIDKITTPQVSLPRDDQGKFTEVFTCVWGIDSKYVKDDAEHEVILEKMI
jgi:ferredoxin